MMRKHLSPTVTQFGMPRCQQLRCQQFLHGQESYKMAFFVTIMQRNNKNEKIYLDNFILQGRKILKESVQITQMIEKMKKIKTTELAKQRTLVL